VHRPMDATVLLVMDVHRVLTEKVFPRQAEVSTVARWAAQLATP
jgi:hypothetical protein